MSLMDWLRERVQAAEDRKRRRVERQEAIRRAEEEAIRRQGRPKPMFLMPEGTVDISVLNEVQEYSGWQQLPDGRIMYDPKINDLPIGRLMYKEIPAKRTNRVIGEAEVMVTTSRANGRIGFTRTQGRGFFGNLTLGKPQPVEPKLVGTAKVNRLVGPGNTHVAAVLIANTVDGEPVYFNNVDFQLNKE